MIAILSLAAAIQAAPIAITWSGEARATGRAHSECLFREADRVAALKADGSARMQTFRGTCTAERATAVEAMERDLTRQGVQAQLAHQRALAHMDERYDIVAGRTFLKPPPQSVDYIPVTRIDAED